MADRATSKKLDRIVARLNAIVDGMEKFQEEQEDYMYDRAMAHINFAISELEQAIEEI